MTLLTIPAWVKTRADNGLVSGMVQFHVRFVGYHEEWFHVGEGLYADTDDLSRRLVACAREALAKRWMGIGKDVRVMGGYFYGPDGVYGSAMAEDIE